MVALATVKLYQDDADAQEFTARVLDCRPAADLSGSALSGLYNVVLDQTLFYPTAGGQPHDTGSLGGVRVIEVVEDESTGTLIHRTEGPLAGQVTGRIDWERRRDHMEQHTGQHLLSQCFVTLLQAETVSFHLGAAYSTIDIAAEVLEQEQVDAVEALANELIREDRPIRIHWARDAAEAMERFPLRKPPAVAERVRIVEIGGFDWSACGGTHLATTGRLGLLKVKGWERHKKGIRVTYLAGGRALADYQAQDLLTRGLCRELSISLSDLPAQVLRLREESQRLKRQLREAQEKLVEAEAAELLGGARLVGGARVVKHLFNSRPVDELKAVAAKVAAHPKAIALFATRGAMPQLVFVRSVDLRADMGAILKQVLPAIEGRGGGSPVAAQGAGSRGEGVSMALDAAMAAVAQQLQV